MRQSTNSLTRSSRYSIEAIDTSEFITGLSKPSWQDFQNTGSKNSSLCPFITAVFALSLYFQFFIFYFFNTNSNLCHPLFVCAPLCGPFAGGGHVSRGVQLSVCFLHATLARQAKTRTQDELGSKLQSTSFFPTCYVRHDSHLHYVCG